MAQLAGLCFPPSTLTASRAVLRPAGWRPACALAKAFAPARRPRRPSERWTAEKALFLGSTKAQGGEEW